MTTQVFQRGETIPIWAEVKNWEGTLINASQGVKITIKKPDGTVAKDNDDSDIDDTAMSNPETGRYVYYYESSAKGTPPVDEPLGWWHYFCKAVDGSGDEEKTVITHGSFKLT